MACAVPATSVSAPAAWTVTITSPVDGADGATYTPFASMVPAEQLQRRPFVAIPAMDDEKEIDPPSGRSADSGEIVTESGGTSTGTSAKMEPSAALVATTKSRIGTLG